MSSEDLEGESPFVGSVVPKPSTSANPQQNLDLLAEQIRHRQEMYTRLADFFFELWLRLPEMTPREIDRWVESMYKQYLDFAPVVGLSRMTLPQLRECCGKKRSAPRDPLLQDPGLTLRTPLPPAPKEELAWWPGDIIRRITRFFGVPYCEKCDQRRRKINRFFGKRD